MLKAVIFDLDGVIVDSTPLQLEANRLFIESMGKVYFKPEGSREGMRIIDIIRDYKDIFNLEGSVEALYTKRQHIFFDLAKENLVLMPGIIELLEKLRSQNIRLAIATSGDREYVLLVFQKFPELGAYFENGVTGDDVERGKPYPDVYKKALEVLDVKPYEAVVIEDSVNGIQAAKTAGIQVVAVPNHHYPEADYSLADREFADLFILAENIIF